MMKHIWMHHGLKAHGYNIFPSGAIRHAKFKHFRTDKEGHECDWSQVEAGDWDSGIKE